VQTCFLIGDADTAAAFALAGVRGVTPENAGEARDSFRAALGLPDAMLLIVTEGFALQLEEEIGKHRLSGAQPMVIEIPENLSGEFGGRSLMESIRRAVGISI
jgi:vacuolar-type H+-ATPase subunit F/Vma7